MKHLNRKIKEAERKREYQERLMKLQLERTDRIRKIEEKHWNGLSKACPECGSILILKKWESYNTGYSWVGPDHYHGEHLYRIYYAHCRKCKWQQRTFEEWIDFESDPK